jgi:hypothetical protein
MEKYLCNSDYISASGVKYLAGMVYDVRKYYNYYEVKTGGSCYIVVSVFESIFTKVSSELEIVNNLFNTIMDGEMRM